MTEGTAQRIRCSGLADLAKLIATLKPTQAIALGALRDDLPDRVRVMTAEMLNGGTPGVIARTQEYLHFREGVPSLALIDHDTKGYVCGSCGAGGGAGGLVACAVERNAGAREGRTRDASINQLWHLPDRYQREI